MVVEVVLVEAPAVVEMVLLQVVLVEAPVVVQVVLVEASSNPTSMSEKWLCTSLAKSFW